MPPGPHRGGKPLDLALTRGDQLLYALDAGAHGIVAFAVRPLQTGQPPVKPPQPFGNLVPVGALSPHVTEAGAARNAAATTCRRERPGDSLREGKTLQTGQQRPPWDRRHQSRAR